MHYLLQGKAGEPAGLFQLRTFMKMAHMTDAQPGNWSDMERDAQGLAHRVMADNGYPDHAQILGRAASQKFITAQTD